MLARLGHGLRSRLLQAPLPALPHAVPYATRGSNSGLADTRQVCYSHVRASPWTGFLNSGVWMGYADAAYALLTELQAGPHPHPKPSPSPSLKP